MHEQKMELIRLLREIDMQLQRRLSLLYEPLGLTGQQARILTELFRQDRQKLSELAGRTGLSLSNLSAICQRLERHGFVRRERSSEDQRVVRICLCPQAREQIEQHGEQMEPRTLFQQLQEQQLDQLIKSLRLLEEILRKEDL